MFTKSVKQTLLRIGRRREKIVSVPGAGPEATADEWLGRLLCRHRPTQFVGRRLEERSCHRPHRTQAGESRLGVETPQCSRVDRYPRVGSPTDQSAVVTIVVHRAGVVAGTIVSIGLGVFLGP